MSFFTMVQWFTHGAFLLGADARLLHSFPRTGGQEQFWGRKAGESKVMGFLIPRTCANVLQSQPNELNRNYEMFQSDIVMFDCQQLDVKEQVGQEHKRRTF